MKLFDISQEVFGCKVFPGDPSPVKEVLMRTSDGDVCNLSKFSMCAHNGTHVDAPFHFIGNGKKVDEVSLDRFVGYAYVTHYAGVIDAEKAASILKAARELSPEASERILVGGNAVLSAEGARVFAAEGTKLYGNESQTVGPEDAPQEVHLIMLGAEVVLLEGIRLSEVPDGVYILDAAPINLGGADGAPCRAVLIEL